MYILHIHSLDRMVPHLVSLTSGSMQSTVGVLAIKRVDELYQAARMEVFRSSGCSYAGDAAHIREQ